MHEPGALMDEVHRRHVELVRVDDVLQRHHGRVGVLPLLVGPRLQDGRREPAPVRRQHPRVVRRQERVRLHLRGRAGGGRGRPAFDPSPAHPGTTGEIPEPLRGLTSVDALSYDPVSYRSFAKR